MINRHRPFPCSQNTRYLYSFSLNLSKVPRVDVTFCTKNHSSRNVRLLDPGFWTATPCKWSALQCLWTGAAVNNFAAITHMLILRGCLLYGSLKDVVTGAGRRVFSLSSHFHFSYAIICAYQYSMCRTCRDYCLKNTRWKFFNISWPEALSAFRNLTVIICLAEEDMKYVSMPCEQWGHVVKGIFAWNYESSFCRQPNGNQL